MNNQQADDVIAEAQRLLKQFAEHGIAPTWRVEISDALHGYYTVTDSQNRRLAECWNGTGPFIAAAPRLVAALVERVSRQPQEVQQLIADLRLTTKWTESPNEQVRASATVALESIADRLTRLAASVSHQPVDAPIAPVVVNSQQEPPQEPEP